MTAPAPLRRLAVLPSGREVHVRAFKPLRAVETSTEAAEVVGGRDGYAYRPAPGVRSVFYAANRGGEMVVKRRYIRARRGASDG